MAASNFISDISRYLISHLDIVIIAIIVISLLTLSAFLSLNLKLSRLLKKYQGLTTGMDGKNLEDLLDYYTSRVKELEEQIQKLQQITQYLEAESKLAIKKVVIKRYDAFNEMGGDLSFSLVLLNDNKNGFIVTSIYGRNENRVFLKPVEGGRSSYTLSPEEREVLIKALN
jgi:cell division protein FtsB